MLRSSRPRRGQAGFSLLEMVVAMVILALSLGALYQATSGATRNVRSDERYAYAVELARSLLADSSQVPRNGHNAGGETAGGYEWRVETQPLRFDSSTLLPGQLQRIRVTVGWRDGSADRKVVLDSVVEGRSPQRRRP